jgi:diadenosine tetraphosphate (Ap4A) HIT family hydrolase
MVLDKNCPFCNLESAKERILGVSENGNYVSIANRVSFVPGGSILLVSRPHAKSFGDLTKFSSDLPALEQEFQAFWNQIAEGISSHYSSPIGFEHGVWGQSVPHAHWQLFPSQGEIVSYQGNNFSTHYSISSRDLIEKVKDKIPKISFFQPRTLKQFEEVFDEEGSYVAFIDSSHSLSNGLVNIAHTNGIPDIPSFFRGVIKSFPGCELYDPNLTEEQRKISSEYLKETIRNLRLSGIEDLSKELKL